ncbi:MAG: hypothetical protein U1F67_03670 [Rubrivivax sp.]
MFKTTKTRSLKRLLAAPLTALGLACAALAQAAGTVGTTFPAGFAVPEDASLAKPVIGFGAAGAVSRVPVIFLHGNNDTRFPTACNPAYGHVNTRSTSPTTATRRRRAMGPGLPGRPLRHHADRPDAALAHRAQQPGQRARPAPLRARGAEVHRREAGGHRRP